MSWEKVRLGDYLNVLSGFAFKSSLFTDDNSHTPVIRIRDIKRSYTETFYQGDYNPNYLIVKGDLVIGMDGEFNIAEWQGTPSLLNQRVCKISSKDTYVLNEKYLFYVLAKYLKEIEDRTSFVTVKHLSIKDINGIQIPLPPLPIQEKIAAILDKADELRRKDQELHKKFDELAQAMFIDMFGDPVRNEKGWEVKRLEEVCSKIGSGSTPRGGKEVYKNSGISLIRSLNIHQNEFKYKDLAFIDDNQAHLLRNVIVESNDVLFNITGASVCRTAIVPDDVLPARVNQHVAILRPNQPQLKSQYFVRLLNNQNMNRMLYGIATQGGATREAVTKEQLEKLEIPIPSIHLQEAFAKKIELINQLKAKVNAERSEELFQSLLQRAFRGELVK